MGSRRNFLKNTIIVSPLVASPGFIFHSFVSKLPNVLIIGDSISIGYTPFVQELMQNKANVFRPVLENGKPENCSGTTRGVDHTDRWIKTAGSGAGVSNSGNNWDIIHFNFGLHDIKHVNPETGQTSSNPKHPQQANVKQYKKNLEIIVEKLKATGAALIFANTTPYPDDVKGPLRKPGMPKKYNRVAAGVMKKNGVYINDLYSFILNGKAEWQLPVNVHFTEEGSRAIAGEVVKKISEVLDKIKTSYGEYCNT